jgi:hypothetical protein
MDSNELINARIAESKAQHAYDRTAALFSAVLTLLAVAIPVAFGFVVLLHTQAENQKQRALSDALHWESRAFQTFGECLDLDRPAAIRELYCEQLSSNVGNVKAVAARVRSSNEITLPIGAMALLLIFIASTIAYLIHGRLKYASAVLGEVQARRIKAEAEVERKSRRHDSRLRYQAARSSAGINGRVRPRRLR